jgi:Uncharacterized protein conserved in bacteria
MEKDSPILFLTICSFHKKKVGNPEYRKQESIVEHLSPSFGSQLLEKRKEIFTLLKSDQIIFDNSNENDHEYNKSLKPSEDLGFSETGGLYLPAIERYNGRFYTSLESGKNKIKESQHHFLIISGLYGLLLAEEPTQLYSVPIEWGCNVQRAWMDNNSITQIFIGYLQKITLSAFLISPHEMIIETSLTGTWSGRNGSIDPARNVHRRSRK